MYQARIQDVLLCTMQHSLAIKILSNYNWRKMFILIYQLTADVLASIMQQAVAIQILSHYWIKVPMSMYHPRAGPLPSIMGQHTLGGTYIMLNCCWTKVLQLTPLDNVAVNGH